MNPMEMMKIGERLRIFQQQHPRMLPFLKDVGEHAVMAGTVVEMKVTDPSGKEYITNIKLTQDDLETIAIVKNMNRK